MIGHLLGAAGGVEAIASILSIKNQIIHPTINIFNQDQSAILIITLLDLELEAQIMHLNSFGFGERMVRLFLKFL